MDGNNAMNANLQHALSKLAANNLAKCIHLYPDITEKHQKNAHSGIKVPNENRILVFLDDSITGSAKRGICVTEEEIYWRTSAGKGNLRIEDINEIEIKPGFFMEIKVNGSGIPVNSSSKEEITPFVSFLKEITSPVSEFSPEEAQHTDESSYEINDNRAVEEQEPRDISLPSESTSAEPALTDTGVNEPIVEAQMSEKELKERIKALLKELHSNDETVRSNSASTLMKIGKLAVPHLKEINKHIESDNGHVSREIARILVHIGESAVPSLIESLGATAAQAALFKNKRASIQRIIDILARIGQPALPGLRNKLKSFDIDGKVAVAMVLQKIDYETHEEAIIQILTKGLEAKFAYVRQWAIDTCITVWPQISGQTQKEAIMMALLKRLYDEDNYVLRHAKEALVKIGKPAVLPLLGFIEGVTESWYSTHGPMLTGGAGQLRRVVIVEDAQIAADVLKGIGKPAVPKLVEVLKDTSGCESLRITVALILGDIGDYNIVPVLGEIVDDKDEQVARAATTAISKFGESAVPFLFKIVRSSHLPSFIDERHQLAENLLVDTVGKAAVPILCEEIRESNEESCKKAIDLLGKIGDRAALPSLKKALNYQDEKVKKKAEKAIKKIEKK